ncbi:hypothetical protein L198_04085 [Cryptococcus wingfieldii CBS 7118]|uniref:RRM domain-containing protein n=1 Tax=Cryptococcus wingfieldii CBS 7118 TaxID=1295528 RepID=A0A1E3J8X4_9TREE|nr:hypothetical protein L198_04085 [Cryptococcus wingfieldii CBS 7118]ODN96371.1 hypothetical protein L198_04085 [Cryptococcus wingfieldii CBS 7118]
MSRQNKPYTRPNQRPDVDGQWKHDLHTESQKNRLVDRITQDPGQDLASRIFGGGKASPQANSAARGSRAGTELFPPGGQPAKRSQGAARGVGVDSRARNMLNDALRQPARREIRQPGQSQVSIMGAARTAIWVRVENLAPGTTPEDVISAFNPLPLAEAVLSSSASSSLVSIDLQVESRADADQLIKQYNGVVADGNTLKVSIVNGLKSRLGDNPTPKFETSSNVAGQELLGPTKSTKLYSDQILAVDPNAAIITLAEEQPPQRAFDQGNSGWRGGRARGGGRNLADRMNVRPRGGRR